MTLIALTLTIAGVTLHPNVADMTYEFNGRETALFTGTDGVQMACTAKGRVTFEFGPARIVADQCKPDRIFRGGFQ